MACYGFIWQRFKRICMESSNGEPKNWHKLNARSSMVLHDKLTKKKCNWNVSCGSHVHAQMASYGFIWQRSRKICMESSNGEPKNRHKLNARSSMVLHDKLTKKKCNWNVSCGPRFMHKWPVMNLFGKGSKEYASKALMGNRKIGTSWMQRSSMVLHEKLTKKKCNWSVSCGPMFMHKMA